jgi:hypothetical protein
MKVLASSFIYDEEYESDEIWSYKINIQVNFIQIEIP